MAEPALDAPTIADNDTGEIIDAPARVERRKTSLVIPNDLSFDEWSAMGEWLESVEGSVMWWVGDWWAFGEDQKYGQRKDVIESDEWRGPPFQTCADAGWVARKFPTSDRSEVLSWTHHRQAAAIENPMARLALLADAERNGWSVRETRHAANRVKNEARLPANVTPIDGRKVFDFNALVRSGEKFGTVYADPPWLYDNQGTRAATGNHYGGMTVAELCELPVREIVADDAHLHLWTTNGFLFECPKIFEAWGFEFRSSFIWVKPQIGIGNYWRNSHEFLLTAIRGDAKRFTDKSLKSWLECERGLHSAKPEQVRHMIERASPNPFLELFARSGAPNWTVWGNQIPGNLLDHDMAEVA